LLRYIIPFAQKTAMSNLLQLHFDFSKQRRSLIQGTSGAAHRKNELRGAEIFLLGLTAETGYNMMQLNSVKSVAGRC